MPTIGDTAERLGTVFGLSMYFDAEVAFGAGAGVIGTFFGAAQDMLKTPQAEIKINLLIFVMRLLNLILKLYQIASFVRTPERQ